MKNGINVNTITCHNVRVTLPLSYLGSLMRFLICCGGNGYIFTNQTDLLVDWLGHRSSGYCIDDQIRGSQTNCYLSSYFLRLIPGLISLYCYSHALGK